ncbi:phospholipase C/P1 nuclease [Panus rudis PR-1116 ss-1]|nr:phospholipase C/P1 nuclease [Panus rudis PR-1116 ss-1]
MLFTNRAGALATLALSISLHNIPTTLAWGAAGHEIVATIAQIYLHPTTLTEVCNVLYPGQADSNNSFPPCHISRVASWADQVRRQPQYRYSASLHYVGALDDHPSDTCVFPGERGWAGRTDHNVLGAVRNVTGIVGDYRVGMQDQSSAEEAIKFLIHFVGDMHMPLHLTGRERGGNGVKVTFDGRVTNLHSLWDSLLLAQALRNIPGNYSHPFPIDASNLDIESHLRGAIYDPYIRRVFHEGFGEGSSQPGRFETELENWLACPQGVPQSWWQSAQTFLGLRRLGDESRWDDDALCPYAWAKELHQLDCDFPIWPRQLDEPPYNHSFVEPFTEDIHIHEENAEEELFSSFAQLDDFTGRPRPHPDLLELDTPEYAGRIRSQWLLERLMAMAGIRLAGILNGLFLDEEEFATQVPVVLGL